jgi:aspartyl-tRNA(Asn)/glutamyl-tRNA(Gln) amidotransferase subunit A
LSAPDGPDILGTAQGVREGSLDPERLVEQALDSWRDTEQGPEPLRSFLALEPGRALAEAARSRRGPLAGVAVAVKDNLVTLGLPTTCGSRLLEDYRSPFEATAVRKLRDAGAIVLGKTNMDEFGMGSSTEHSAYGPTRNPVDRSRVPGGSSGGSAAAVAAGIVRAALGSDTGGSIRQPAAFCGVVGIKPTYGSVSRYGLVAYASSLDQVGTFGRTVTDAAALLEVIAGADPLDSTSVQRPAPHLLEGIEGGVQGLVVGVPEEYFVAGLDPRIAERCRAALERLREMGAETRKVSLPHTSLAIPTYYVLAPAEASANLARFDGVRFGVRPRGSASLGELYERTRSLFGAEVKRRIMLGTYTLSSGYYDAYYGRAQRVRELIAGDFRSVFSEGVDALLTPTTPGPAFPLGERLDDPVSMYLSDVFTVTANLAGLPALSLPVGAVEGLPVGLQLIGRPWAEDIMVRIARALERSTESGWSDA